MTEVAVETLLARGEPARYERILGDIRVGLDRDGHLRRLAEAMRSGDPPPEAIDQLDGSPTTTRRSRRASAERDPDPDPVERLLALIEDRLGSDYAIYEIFLDPADGQGQAWLHDRGEVMGRENYSDGRTKFTVRLDDDKAGQALARFGRSMRPAQKLKAAAE